MIKLATSVFLSLINRLYSLLSTFVKALISGDATNGNILSAKILINNCSHLIGFKMPFSISSATFLLNLSILGKPFDLLILV